MKQLSSLLKISVSLFFVLFHLTASGGTAWGFSTGAGEAGMGYVCVMKSGFWSSFHNQASLAYISSISSGFNYENRFGIKELGTSSAGMQIPVAKASVGLVYTHFGYTDFKREMAGLACGMKLSDKIAAGVQVDYISERTSGEYNNNRTVTFETGLIVLPNENTRIGIHIFNPLPNSLRNTYLPVKLRIGAGTNLSKTLFAGVEAEMSSGSKLIVRTGFEYEAAKRLWLRGGFSTNNNSFSFGTGFLAKFSMIDLGFTTHERLGVTTSVSIVFKIH